MSIESSHDTGPYVPFDSITQASIRLGELEQQWSAGRDMGDDAICEGVESQINELFVRYPTLRPYDEQVKPAN